MRYLKSLLHSLVFFSVVLVSGAALSGDKGGSAVMEPIQSPVFKLIMFEELGCEYCDLWNEEIGAFYSKTPEGQFAPLTRVFKGDPRVSQIKRVIYTPTFVVLHGDREIGRILGYPGEEFFWAFLGDILQKAGFKPGS